MILLKTIWRVALVLLSAALGVPAAADTAGARPGGPPPLIGAPAPNLGQPGQQCRRAVQAAGRAAGIPEHLMSAIGRIESGRRGPDGQVHPWPWSINAEGIDHVFDTRDEVIAKVRALQAQGIRSIDVGCMQVNLMYHPTAFATLEQAFDPTANATYAARFLKELFGQSGSWEKATAAYHSANPELGTPYQQKVAAALPEEARMDNTLAPLPQSRLPGIRPGARGMAGTMLRTGRQTSQATQRNLDAYRAAPVRLAVPGGV